MQRLKWILTAFLFIAGTTAWAENLVIHAAEIGVGKFHRRDNSYHPYASDNLWSNYILPNNAGERTPVVVDHTDGSVSIFFSSLQELLETSLKISKQRNLPISVLNLNGHGLPGGMWFPMDERQKNSVLCGSWRDSAGAEDGENYNQYYSPVSKNQILQIRSLANSTGSATYPCTTGLSEWQSVVAKIPGLKEAFASDAQIHFFSCTVGLGVRGDQFTKGIAKLLLSTPQGQIQTSLPFGLGDWSMPEGMGFWDYQNDAQLDQDNARYPDHRKDSEQAQKGNIRVAFLQSSNSNEVSSGVLKNVDFMIFGKDDRVPSLFLSQNDLIDTISVKSTQMPPSIRIPGTGVTLYLQK